MIMTYIAYSALPPVERRLCSEWRVIPMAAAASEATGGAAASASFRSLKSAVRRPGENSRFPKMFLTKYSSLPFFSFSCPLTSRILIYCFDWVFCRTSACCLSLQMGRLCCSF
jgi:hypothetical protein